MSNRYEMRFAGSGGQGVILASVIIAEAAVISGINAVQSQAYGPEARGGVSKAEAILSKEYIWYSKVTRPAFLLALTQASLDKYSKELAEQALLQTSLPSAQSMKRSPCLIVILFWKVCSAIFRQAQRN